MVLEAEATWKRYGLVADLARRFHERKLRLGRTALQKMVFLLQTSFGVECGYDYVLYTYGPYSADLARDLDIVTSFGGVLPQDSGADPGYVIDPGPECTDLRGRALGFLTSISPQLDLLVAHFGHYNSRELELRTTVLFASRTNASHSALVKSVHEAKPHFSLDQIGAAIDDLRTMGYLETPVEMAAHS